MENIEWLFVGPETPLIDILDKQNNAGRHDLPAGVVIVVDRSNKIIGTITDGDVRRSLIKNSSIDQKANDIMNSDLFILVRMRIFKILLNFCQND